MSLETWLAFVCASCLVLVIPGPTIILVIGQAMTHGRRVVAPLVAGVTLGDFTAMTFSLLGLGTLLAASAELFLILKWIGAAYLVYLGLRLWRSDPAQKPRGLTAAASGKSSPFRSAWLVTALNPKGIAFFVAFLPQFISAENETAPQLILLGATFLVLAAVNAALYALFAGRLRDAVKDARVLRWFNRCGGSALIGAGVFSATLQRTS